MGLFDKLGKIAAVGALVVGGAKLIKDAVDKRKKTANDAPLDNQKQQAIPQSTGNTQSEVFYCSSCGTQLKKGAKFCSGCGMQIGESLKEDSTSQTTRTQEYAGTILKCPNCGESINKTTAICPSCGHQIVGASAIKSETDLYNRLMEIEKTRKKNIFGMGNEDEVDEKKLTLIQNFPIPNTIDDIINFMVLANTNINVKLSKHKIFNNNEGDYAKKISDAWVLKMQQMYQKAEIMFASDPRFAKIRDIYVKKMTELKIKI